MVLGDRLDILPRPVQRSLGLGGVSGGDWNTMTVSLPVVLKPRYN